MYIYQDNIYKTDNGYYYTESYIQNHGYISGNVWHKHIDELIPITLANFDIKPNNVLVKCNYEQLFGNGDSLVMCNDIWNYSNLEEIELENGEDYDEENDEHAEIMQTFIIDNNLANRLIEHTDELIYYHNKLNVYLLAVTHWGTAWENTSAEYTI